MEGGGVNVNSPGVQQSYGLGVEAVNKEPLGPRLGVPVPLAVW